MNRMLIFFPILLCSAMAFAQDLTDPSRIPVTRLEAFQARTGVVLIRGISTVGTLRGSGYPVPASSNGQVVVDARELRDGSSPSSPSTTGVSITLKETEGLYRENVSYVDFDQIDSLVKGIEYISKVSKDVTKLDHFEAEYRTKGDLRITVFNRDNGEVTAAISNGTVVRITIRYLSLAQLEMLRQLILDAKAKLNS